jgi:adenine phosphoribosyltransferase
LGLQANLGIGLENMRLKSYIRDVPDFPQAGILFRDITPLIQSPEAFRYTIGQLVDRYKSADLDVVVAVESRGFLFGAPLAYELGKPIVPVRKPGKLPAETHQEDYALEYGNNTMEIHVDGILPGQKALILDDLLATGGTLAASARLVEKCGGLVSGIGVVIELTDLGGREILSGYDIFSILEY